MLKPERSRGRKERTGRNSRDNDNRQQQQPSLRYFIYHSPIPLSRERGAGEFRICCFSWFDTLKPAFRDRTEDRRTIYSSVTASDYPRTFFAVQTRSALSTLCTNYAHMQT